MGPFEVFNIVLGGMAAATVALMIRNLRVTHESPPYARLFGRLGRESSDGAISVYVEGRRLVGIAYVSDRLPREGEDLPSRLVNLARSSRISVTFVSSMFAVRKSSVVRLLEEEIRKAEFAYSATRHVKYRERLAFLEGLYKEVMRTNVPYVGSFGMIVWVDPKDRDSVLNAEAFKELVEAEANIKFRRASPSDLGALVMGTEDGWLSRDSNLLVAVTREQVSDVTGVVIGEDVDNSGNLVILKWPEAFRVHVGIFGPTGRGKTVLLSGIASQLASLSHTLGDPYSVVVIDPKGDLAQLLARVADRVVKPALDECVPMRRLDGIAERLIESSRETGEGAPVKVCIGSPRGRGLTVYDLSSLPNEVRNVYGSLLLSSLALEASEGSLGGRTVVVVDEAWRLARGSAVHFEFALREGRSKGLYVIYATQLPSDLGRPLVDNTGYKFVFGGFTNSYVELAAQLAIDNPEELRSLPVGYALLRDELGRTKKVRVVDFAKILKGPTSPPGAGEDHNGEELKAAEGGQGLANIQEP